MDVDSMEYEQETLERIEEKSQEFYKLFKKLIDKTPIRYDTPSRMKNGNYGVNRPHLTIHTSPLSSDEYTGISLQNIIKKYDIKNELEDLQAVVGQRAFGKGETPNFRSYWEALQSIISIIEKFAKAWQVANLEDSNIPLTVRQIIAKKCLDPIDREIEGLMIEWIKMPSDTADIKNGMKDLLVKLYSEDANVVLKWIHFLYSV